MSFNLHLNVFVAQVIWVIGASMVVLAGLVYLPRWAIAAAGLIMIAGHNLLDTIHPEHLGAAAAGCGIFCISPGSCSSDRRPGCSSSIR